MRGRGEGPRRAGGLAAGLISACAALLAAAPASHAEFPYPAPSGAYQYSDLRTAPGQVPSELTPDADNTWKYSATADPANAINNARPTELGGVRGGHLVDADPAAETAWRTTTGRPDVTIATLDSGIKWNEVEAMEDLRFKTHLNRGELPLPLADRASSLAGGGSCAAYASAYDANGDGVFNITDYGCDSRVNVTDPRRVGPAGMLTPQDLLIAFSNGNDADANGYADDIVGWDFLDDDNDPFDDVQYGHGTGEAQGSSGEEDNGGDAGACPNCMVMHMRVGDSFIADVNRFAEAAIYATDNGALVIQEALGTLNNSSHARQAVEYAYRHGVTTIASAADEAAQHNNWPSSLPHVILVNSVIQSPKPTPDQSYLAFNGCTNFNSKVTLAIPSTSCSSDATGVGSGMAGIVYSAAYNAFEKGALDEHPNCELTGDGPDPGSAGPDPCVITANEVRQVMASGTVDTNPAPGDAVRFADDVNFASPAGGPEPSCSPVPTPGCTDPNGALWAQVDANRALGATGRSYPARRGHDQFYGYGRVNVNRTVKAIVDDPATPSPTELPPEAELSSPTWYEQVDPARSALAVSGQVYARGEPYSCEVLVAPGHYPDDNRPGIAQPEPGDFQPVPAAGGACDGGERRARADGKLAEISIAALESRFPPGTDFTGPEPPASAASGNGRPNPDPHGFVVKVVASTTQGGKTLTGEDRRAAFLHRDQDMLAGYPRAISDGGAISGSAIPTSDGASSPAFADLDGDNRNELIFGTTDGYVHALRPDGSELPGWPVRSDAPGFVASHSGTRAYESGEVSGEVGGAVLGSVAVADANRDGLLEVYAADLEGKVYGWDAGGQRVFTEQANPDWSGKPLQPFANVRRGRTNRTQHGFISSPVLADLDGDGGRQELVIAGMDRHLYAWRTDDADPGAPGGAAGVEGFPTLVVDPAKVESIDPQTHRVQIAPGSFMQGAIIDTPAVGDVAGDSRPEIVLGTNEEYDEELNSGNVTTATYGALAATGVLGPGNSRLFAIRPEGDRDGDPSPGDAILPSWPFAVGIMNTELLPVVGEGISGAPVIAPVDCPSGGPGPKIGVLANNGPAYVLNPNASSCYGNDPTSGKPNALEVDFGASPQQYDHPLLPAVGHPAFGRLGPGTTSFLSPAAGLQRALDVAVPEYQEGQDFVAAWNASTSQLEAGYPSPANDLQFLTGPSIADLDGAPGEEVVAGTASKDLVAFNAAGGPVNPRWPKLTGDWTVANPLIGSFGTLDTDQGARKVIVGLTRSGYVSAYRTVAPACTPGSWPRFHHDNANSGDMRRDAALPGKPYETRIASGELRFRAPGDDLLCGTAERYTAVTSNRPIDERNFDAAQPLAGGPQPAPAGSEQRWAPRDAKRYVAIRAVDDQRNLGRVALFQRGGR
jgi:hypothetical protein